MPITVDLHTHTAHSHAKDSAEAMAASAYGKGFAVFGFSEHSPRPDTHPYPGDYRERLTASFPAYIAEVLAEKERYAGRMEVLLGLEMDYMSDQAAYMENAVAQYPYDYVIGGLHFLGRWGFDYTAADWESLSNAACSEYFIRYYRDLARMAESGLFHIAAHPDLIKIFRKETFASWVATPDARLYVRAALESVKDAGMAMEISSAGFRKGLGEPYPCDVVMEIARDVEVPVSFGSDAHAAKDVGAAFDELAAYARRYGYAQSAVFRGGALSLASFV